MFRFKKQRLLMTNYQTPEVKNEENWIRLVMQAARTIMGCERIIALIYQGRGSAIKSKTMIKLFLPVPYSATSKELFQR